MPELGEIRKGTEVGKKNYHKFIWYACPDCLEERWMVMVVATGEPLFSRYCQKCGASRFNKTPEKRKTTSEAQMGDKNPMFGVFKEAHPAWGGGEFIKGGYVYIYQPEHPKARKKYVKRAILNLEAKLGRYIRDDYDSHHIDEDKLNDDPTNLEERPHSTHGLEHMRRAKNAVLF